MQDNRVGHFPTTRWSLVVAAADSDARQGSGEALCTLCRIYWYPLYAFIRRQGYSTEDAQDLTQGFFAVVLEKNYVQDFKPECARFRTFLLTSAKHFLSNERDRACAQKRGGGRRAVRLDLTFDLAEQRYSEEPAHSVTPEKIFEKQWALALIDQVQCRLAAEWACSGKGRQFDLLKAFVTGDDTLPPYKDIAVQLQSREGAVKVAVHRLRRRFSEVLRSEIAQTVADPMEVDEEIRFLFAAIEA